MQNWVWWWMPIMCVCVCIQRTIFFRWHDMLSIIPQRRSGKAELHGDHLRLTKQRFLLAEPWKYSSVWVPAWCVHGCFCRKGAPLQQLGLYLWCGGKGERRLFFLCLAEGDVGCVLSGWGEMWDVFTYLVGHFAWALLRQVVFTPCIIRGFIYAHSVSPGVDQ